MLEFIVYFICITCLILMGLFAIVENRNKKSNQTFFYISITAALWILSLYLAYYFERNDNLVLIFTRLANSIPIITLFLIGKFFYEFPTKSYKLPKFIKMLFGFTLIGSALISAFTF